MGKIISFEEAQAKRDQEGKGDAKRVGNAGTDNGKRLAKEIRYPSITRAERYALKAFREKVASFRRPYKLKVPSEFEKMVLDTELSLPRDVLDHIGNLPADKKGELVFAMVQAVHDGWVRDCPDYFFDTQYYKDRFAYMPIELCGSYVYQERLNEIMNIVHELNLDYSWMSGATNEVYAKKRREFIRDRGLTNANLWKYVSNVGEDYLALNNKVAEYLRRNSYVADEIAKQIIEWAPLGGLESC